MRDFVRLTPRSVTRAIDLAMLSLALGFAFLFRFDGDIPPRYVETFFVVWLYVVALQYGSLLVLRVPSFAWKYVGLPEAIRIFAALAASASVILALRFGLADWLLHEDLSIHFRIPVGVILIDLVLAFLWGPWRYEWLIACSPNRTACGATESARTRRPRCSSVPGKRALTVAKEVKKRRDLGIRLVGFIDDDPEKHGKYVSGLRVLGPTSEIGSLAQRSGAKEAIITMANPTGEDIRRVRALCSEAHVALRIIPSMFDILEGRVNLREAREVSIEDLLRRPVVKLGMERLSLYLKGRRVLVSGAGGSIGSEICRQVSQYQPAELVLLERSEAQLFSIHSELRRVAPGVEIVPCLTDLCDEDGLETVFEEHRPHVVFHAAAFKHVPMLEWNSLEAVKNNVVATRGLIDAADRHGVQSFVRLSTDKAVNPTSIMGATKTRLARCYSRRRTPVPSRSSSRCASATTSAPRARSCRSSRRRSPRAVPSPSRTPRCSDTS